MSKKKTYVERIKDRLLPEEDDEEGFAPGEIK